MYVIVYDNPAFVSKVYLKVGLEWVNNLKDATFFFSEEDAYGILENMKGKSPRYTTDWFKYVYVRTVKEKVITKKIWVLA